MQGASRGALRAGREALQEALGAVQDRAALGEELLAVCGVVGGSAVLRRALADPSREGADKAALAAQVFGGKVGEPAQQVTATVVAQRWGSAADLVTALEALGVEAILAQAEAEGRLDRVEDELFRFNRIVSGDSALLTAFSDRRASAAAKGDLARELLSDKVAPETSRLAQHAVAGLGRSRFDHAIESFLKIAAQRQDQLTATVTSAVPLSQEQQDRLVRTLSEQYDRAVHINVILDPGVVGGIRVEIGDEVIDGTIASRLDDARRRLTG